MHKTNTSLWSRYWSVVVLAFVLVLSAFLFMHKQTLFHCNLPIDEKMFGAYGSFVGGVLTFISVFLLVETLRDQRVSTAEQREFIREQRRQTDEQLMLIREQVGEGNFNSLFWGLLQHLQKEIEMLEFETYAGKSYFGILCLRMQEAFKLEPEESTWLKVRYENNIYWATSYYISLYAKHPELASYFRLLYRVCVIVDKSDLNDAQKLEYMKILRAQLTSGELFLLRYNAYTPYGVHFQTYICKYNLLKHLPAFDLLELNNWWREMTDRERYQASALVYLLRKDIRSLLEGTDKEIRQDRFKHNGWVYEVKKESGFDIKILLCRTDESADKIFSQFCLYDMEQLVCCILFEVFMFSHFAGDKLRDAIDVACGQWQEDSLMVVCKVISKVPLLSLLPED